MKKFFLASMCLVLVATQALASISKTSLAHKIVERGICFSGGDWVNFNSDGTYRNNSGGSGTYRILPGGIDYIRIAVNNVPLSDGPWHHYVAMKWHGEDFTVSLTDGRTMQGSICRQ